MIVLSPNQNIGGSQRKTSQLAGGSHPPKKKREQRLLITIILPYSPKKKRANPMEEYSTLYPATSSASASGKSKGALLVSARQEIKKRKSRGKGYCLFLGSF